MSRQDIWRLYLQTPSIQPSLHLSCPFINSIMSEDTSRHRKEGSKGSNPKPMHSKGQQEHRAKSTQQQNRKPERKAHRERAFQRSRSTDSEPLGRSRGRHRDREREDGKVRRERGRSEEAGRRDRRKETNNGYQHRSPASPNDDLGDTECPVCFCAYNNGLKTPKLLSCGHTFCLECLARINVTSPELKQISCPVCREITQLPHGRDLPQLGNNQAVFEKLPPEMQRALSVRFKRSKGKLELKSKSVHQNPTTVPTLKKQETTSNNQSLGLVEAGVADQVTSVDVGRPPNRMHCHMQRVFRSNQCYYISVGTIIAVTVALMLVGVLIFVVIPRVSYTGGGRPPPGNGTHAHPGSGGLPWPISGITTPVTDRQQHYIEPKYSTENWNCG